MLFTKLMSKYRTNYRRNCFPRCPLNARVTLPNIYNGGDFFVFNCRFSEKHFKKEHVTQKHHRRVVRKQFRGLEQRNWLYLGINAKRKEEEIKT